MSKRDTRVTLRQIAEYGRHAQAICENKSAHEIAADWREALPLNASWRCSAKP
jgi:hypothetical protein